MLRSMMPAYVYLMLRHRHFYAPPLALCSSTPRHVAILFSLLLRRYASRLLCFAFRAADTLLWLRHADASPFAAAADFFFFVTLRRAPPSSVFCRAFRRFADAFDFAAADFRCYAASTLAARFAAALLRFSPCLPCCYVITPAKRLCWRLCFTPVTPFSHVTPPLYADMIRCYYACRRCHSATLRCRCRRFCR